MPSSFSPSLRLELIANGEQAGTWGQTTNTNIGTLIESAVAGYTDVAVVSAVQALTRANGATDEARSAMLRLTTALGSAFAVYAPPVTKQYTVFNASAQNATIYNSTVPGNTTAAGAGVTIPAGKTLVVFSDGASFRTIESANLTGTLAVANGGTGATDAATARANLGTVSDPGSNGLLARTSANTTATRTITVSGTGLSITNGDGAVGNPAIAINATNGNTGSTVVARDASGNFSAGTVTASLAGNASTATTLQTVRAINGTSFNGAADITTANWGTTRTITIGATGKSVNGSGNVAWSLGEIGAADATATVNLTGNQTVAGTKTFSSQIVASGGMAGNVTGNLNGNLTAAAPTAATQAYGTNNTAVATTAFVQAALQALYPVGSVYINAAVGTNPASLFGFGTWAEIGAGRVMVGQNAGDAAFDSLGETGGSKDAVVVSHTHTASTNSAGEHTHGVFFQNIAASSGGTQSTPRDTGGTYTTSAAGAHTHTVTIDSAGSSGTNANLQPYIVVKMWQRTA
jgi:hypothetical protein